MVGIESVGCSVTNYSHMKLGRNLLATPNLHIKNYMTNNAIILEDLLQALREIQSLTPKLSTGDPKTQIDLPEVIMTRTRLDASRMGVSPEVLIMALLQAFSDADESFKAKLEEELSSVLNAGEDNQQL